MNISRDFWLYRRLHGSSSERVAVGRNSIVGETTKPRSLFISPLNGQLVEPEEQGRSKLCGLLTHGRANLRPFSERSKGGGNERQSKEKEEGKKGREAKEEGSFGERKEITSCKIVASTFRRSRNSRGQVKFLLLFIPSNFV